MSDDAPAGDGPALLDGYDGLLVDIDGVVLLDTDPIAGAADALAAARARGVPIAFVTNNAAREPAEIVTRLGSAGVSAEPDEVMTSALAAAQLLRSEEDAGAPVLVVGGAGLRAAVRAAGLRGVDSAADRPVAVVQGWGPDVAWADLAEATVALRAGARWVVTNRDCTLPSPRGPLPGSGALVGAVVAAIDRQPDVVVGKPGPALFEAARNAIGASRPLVVGDRLDTDIAGARAAGMASLLVLTGVARPADVLAAAEDRRPDHLGPDLGALLCPAPVVSIAEGLARSGTATAFSDGRVDGSGFDALRAVVALAWSGQLDPAAAATALARLG